MWGVSRWRRYRSNTRSSFLRYWTAAAISSFGTAVTAVAMPVLVIQLLGAHTVGGRRRQRRPVRSVCATRAHRRCVHGPVASQTSPRVGQRWASAFLAAIPALWLSGALQVWMLVIALLSFGAFSVFGFAATQSLLPRLVPRTRLVWANARLDQADSAAATLGPAVGGGLIGILGAPVVIVVDAISYLVDAALIASVRADEPQIDSQTRNLRAEIRDGLQWTYRHRILGLLAVSTHVWFLANGAAMTVLSLLALRSLGFTAYTFGMLLTVFGVASLIGASVAARAGARFGSGQTIILTRIAYPITWILVAVAPATGSGVAVLFVAMGLQGLAAGMENSNEMGYWQSLTSDELLGRTNATRRSINRTAAAIGALVAGLFVGLIGDRLTLIGVIIAFVIAALTALLSPLRQASISD